jgi:hypothetical protein
MTDGIKQDWPPTYLGEIPDSEASILEMPEIESLRKC